jgi:hypothetical protein
MRSHSRILKSAALIGLALAVQEAPALAGFEPGPLSTIAISPSRPPLAVAAFSDDDLFALHSQSHCDDCVPGLDLCEHERHSQLVHYQRQAGGGWTTATVCDRLPATVDGLAAGPDATLVYAADREGTLEQLRLTRSDGRWYVADLKTLLRPEQFKELGLPGQWQTCAVARDGGLILGFGDAVVRLPPGGASSKKDVRRLYSPVESKGGGALLVAVDAAGQVWVVDDQARTAFTLAPKGQKVTMMGGPDCWPAGFTPLDVGVSGGQLFVSGRAAGATGAATQLLVLTPGAKAVPATRQILTHPFTFALTPGGHVALCDLENGRLRLLPNGPAESKPEPRPAVAAAEVKAQPATPGLLDPKAKPLPLPDR